MRPMGLRQRRHDPSQVSHAEYISAFSHSNGVAAIARKTLFDDAAAVNCNYNNRNGSHRSTNIVR